MARAALPGMATRGHGRVVVITSSAVRQPQAGLAVSVVLRSAMTAAAKLLARPSTPRRGVTVNCVAPGSTDTARFQQVVAARAAAGRHQRRGGRRRRRRGRARPAGPGTPEEVAAAVAFLASPVGRVRQRHGAHRRRRADGDDLVSFDMAAFLASLTPEVTPGRGRPLVVRAEDFQPLPAGQVHNPTHLAVAGDLPTVTFEIFRQEIPAGRSSDVQRHHHETVHYVISGHGATPTWRTRA